MFLPLLLRRWRHLDEWDAAIFVVGLAVGAALVAVSGVAGLVAVSPISLAVWAGFMVGGGGMTLRRRFDRKLLEREAGPPRPPLSAFGLLLVALGIFAMLVAMVGALLALALAADLTESSKNAEAIPLYGRAAILGFPLVCAASGLGMIRLARRRAPA